LAKTLNIVGLLSAHDADFNARGNRGRTALHYAVQDGRAISVPLVGSLLSFGADPSLRDDDGLTPADWARVQMRANLEEVLALLEGERRPTRGRRRQSDAR
jgi:ankyrin repeat protein